MTLLRTLLLAPHRFFFALGFGQWLILLVFWTLEMLARVGGNDAPWSALAPARWLHAALFLFGPFPAWIFAFLFTAMPRWLRLPPLAPRAYLPGGATIAAGWLLVDLALFAGARTPLLAGVGVVGAGWGMLLLPLWRIARRAPPGDYHAKPVAAAVSLGVPALWITLAGIVGGHAGLVGLGQTLAVWCFLLPVFVIVAHRMLPFFTRSAAPTLAPWQPAWVLFALLAALAGSGLLAWRWPAASWVPAAAGAGLAATLSRRWHLRAALADRLLATHHLALLWLSAGFALAALQSALLAAGVVWGGNAPLHALLFGFCTTMAFGMATRVTLGHSGQPIGATPRLWRLFLALQVAVVLRLLADFVPALARGLLPLAIVATLAVFALWLRDYARYWAVDGEE
jgi:uncharacterized protein involved in response to NO